MSAKEYYHVEEPDARWMDQPYLFFSTRIVNGDIGIVEDVTNFGNGIVVIVRFENPERLCYLPIGECHLQRAYCMTAHLGQGSGYPYVIIPLSKLFYKGLWCRELVYTMFSRAEDMLVTVGELDALADAISRKTIHLRKTRLKERMIEQRSYGDLEQVAFDVSAGDRERIATPELRPPSTVGRPQITDATRVETETVAEFDDWDFIYNC